MQRGERGHVRGGAQGRADRSRSRSRDWLAPYSEECLGVARAIISGAPNILQSALGLLPTLPSCVPSSRGELAPWRGVHAVVDLGLRRTYGRGSSSQSARHGDEGRVRRVYGRMGRCGFACSTAPGTRERASLTISSRNCACQMSVRIRQDGFVRRSQPKSQNACILKSDVLLQT